MYKLNNEGHTRNKYVVKEFTKGIIIEPIIYSFIIILVYFSVGTKSILYFYLMTSYILVWYIVGMFATIKMLKRQNKTISEVYLLNENIEFKTDKILWLKAGEYQQNRLSLHFENRKFKWYGKKTEKEGLSIFVNDIELFLVKEYFDDYENIKKLLTEK